MTGRNALYTIGHGRAGADEIAALLRANGVESVIDVRSVPKSRLHPHVWSDRLAEWIPELAGATYDWRRELGGFRKPRPDSPNVAWRNESFRGYADYMQTEPFLAALRRLAGEAGVRRTAVLCSESLWWRCHRRLIADAAVLLHGLDAVHIMHGAPPVPHAITPGARVLAPGVVQYDA